METTLEKEKVSIHVKTYLGIKHEEYHKELMSTVEDLWLTLNKFENIQAINIIMDKEGLKKGE